LTTGQKAVVRREGMQRKEVKSGRPFLSGFSRTDTRDTETNGNGGFRDTGEGAEEGADQEGGPKLHVQAIDGWHALKHSARRFGKGERGSWRSDQSDVVKRGGGTGGLFTVGRAIFREKSVHMGKNKEPSKKRGRGEWGKKDRKWAKKNGVEVNLKGEGRAV